MTCFQRSKGHGQLAKPLEYGHLSQIRSKLVKKRQFQRGAGHAGAMTIASHLWLGNAFIKYKSPARAGRKWGGRPQGPFVPDGTFGNCEPRVPAMNGWAILNGARNGARIPKAAGNMNTYGRWNRGKAVSRCACHRSPRPGGNSGRPRPTRSVLECASPLALWHAAMGIPPTGRVARPVKYGGDNGKPWRRH